jgi:hypothetical protein
MFKPFVPLLSLHASYNLHMRMHDCHGVPKGNWTYYILLRVHSSFISFLISDNPSLRVSNCANVVVGTEPDNFQEQRAVVKH